MKEFCHEKKYHFIQIAFLSDDMSGSLNEKAKFGAWLMVIGVIFIGIILIYIYYGSISVKLEEKGEPSFEQSSREKRQVSLLRNAQVDVLESNDTLAIDMDNKTNANAMTKGKNLACNEVIQIFFIFNRDSGIEICTEYHGFL